VEGFRRTSGFGDRRTFLYTGGKTDRSIHTGIDFATPKERLCTLVPGDRLY
jgi:murein DD-endopeptidase MepM/ murein hydrolase activator NlpD